MIFTIVDKSTLNSTLPQDVIKHVGYKGEPTLLDKVLVCSELDNGAFAISVNLKAPDKQCAWTDLNEQEIELAKLLYGESNLLTIEQYKKLNFKQIEP